MTETAKTGVTVDLLINGIAVRADPQMTIVEAAWAGGVPRITSVGCLEGVCGSCRVLVKRGREVKVALACETFVEQGMEAVFLPAPATATRRYDLADLADGWDTQARFHEIFPEAIHCRHCSGCVNSCPKGIRVEEGVEMAAAGHFREAGAAFLECVMCELCDVACPENISPAHVGLFSRRITAHYYLRPPNLIQKLEDNRKDKSAVKKPIFKKRRPA
jgi:succinate dehydrogenase/fumarate reductase-like Fe-S protein